MSLDLTLPDDWRSWDPHSKDRLIWRLKAEAILQGQVETFCTFETPSAMAKHYLGDRWHHRAYHDELDQLALDLRAGVVDRAAISQPPQTGKSTAVNWLIFWWQALNPTHPIMRVSYAADLAIMHANYVHRLVTEHGGDFGLVPQRGAQKQNNWETLTGAGLRSGGILTGMSGFPAALMVIDDPLAGRAQANSKLVRDKVWDEISGSLISRMRPESPLLYVLCMTGDTPVLMADGNERPLRDVRPGDSVATYEDGKLTSSLVRNWANQGTDHVYAVVMASGRTVRANARHPFLTVDCNGETWRKTSELKPGMRIRGLSAEPGQGPRVLWTTATEQSAQKVCACRTTRRHGGQQETEGARTRTTDGRGCATSTGSTPKTMTSCLPSKAECAPSAIESPRRRTHAASVGSSWITATTACVCEDCSVTTAISSSDTGRPRNDCSRPLSTFELTTDEIVAVYLDGQEDVFDIQVDRTENFIANGLVSHNTRWHEDDPVGRAVKQEGSEAEGGRYRVINLPAIDGDGVPLQHPWIDPDDVRAALKHWEDKRRTSTLRDWYSLYQGDPKPVEGALLTEEQVKAATLMGDLPEFVKTGVAIDPSGGGRDVAGIIGGGLTADGKVIVTHDRSDAMSSEEWTHEACLLAHELEANEIIYERNFGADTAKFLLRSVWNKLAKEAEEAGEPEWGPCPRIVEVHAKKGKRVRAEPIAVQITLGNMLFWALKVLDVGSEWCTWQEDSNESPGRIDASSYLAYRWLKIPGAEANVSTIGLDEMPKSGTGKGTLAGRRMSRGR